MIALLRIRPLACLVALAFTAPLRSAAEEVAQTGANECPVQASLAVAPGPQKHAVQLELTLRIAAPWYIYVKSTASAVLEIDLQLPPGASADGDWIRPKPRVVYQGERVEVYSGDQVLRLNLRVDPARRGRVTATVRFQACDPTICRPAEELVVSADLAAQPPS